MSREEAEKIALNRCKTVALAFHQYHDVYKELPPAAVVSKNNTPLLSWRVLLLPYVGQEKLFREFKLTEPWDSAHNVKLLAKMPDVYCPVLTDTVPANETLWQVFTGPGTVFEQDKQIKLPQIVDGTVNTIMFVEAARSVPWTKPADLPYDANKPLPKLGHMFTEYYLLALCDGSVSYGKKNFDEKTMRLAITRGDQMPFNITDLFFEK
jgi:hypothetical protein